MHMNAQRPVFVPKEYRAEIEQMSKAALMDMVWDLAIRCSGTMTDDVVMAEIRTIREIILTHRKQAKSAA